MAGSKNIEELHLRRTSTGWRQRVRRLVQPPAPFVADPDELKIDAPLGRWNLYIGGAGSKVHGYVNVDLFLLPGVDVVANGEQLPFRSGCFARVECDAVLEHVESRSWFSARSSGCSLRGVSRTWLLLSAIPFMNIPETSGGSRSTVCG